MKPFFNWTSTNATKKTFGLSASCARTPMSAILEKTFKSSFPSLNAKHRLEHTAINTICSDALAVDHRLACSWIFVGTKTLVTDVCSIKIDKNFANKLEDSARKSRDADKLISNEA